MKQENIKLKQKIKEVLNKEIDLRAKELDEMGRNLVKINKEKWLKELFDKKGVIHSYDLEELL